MATDDLGVDVHLARNPANGLYDLVLGSDGNPVDADASEHAILTQTIEERESAGHPGWVVDTEGRHGSLLYLVTEDRPSTISDLKHYALDAFQTLIDDGQILGGSDLLVTAERQAAGRYELDVQYKTPSGEPKSTRIILTY